MAVGLGHHTKTPAELAQDAPIVWAWSEQDGEESFRGFIWYGSMEVFVEPPDYWLDK